MEEETKKGIVYKKANWDEMKRKEIMRNTPMGIWNEGQDGRNPRFRYQKSLSIKTLLFFSPAFVSLLLLLFLFLSIYYFFYRSVTPL